MEHAGHRERGREMESGNPEAVWKNVQEGMTHIQQEHNAWGEELNELDERGAQQFFDALKADPEKYRAMNKELRERQGAIRTTVEDAIREHLTGLLEQGHIESEEDDARVNERVDDAVFIAALGKQKGAELLARLSPDILAAFKADLDVRKGHFTARKAYWKLKDAGRATKEVDELADLPPYPGSGITENGGLIDRLRIAVENDFDAEKVLDKDMKDFHEFSYESRARRVEHIFENAQRLGETDWLKKNVSEFARLYLQFIQSYWPDVKSFDDVLAKDDGRSEHYEWMKTAQVVKKFTT